MRRTIQVAMHERSSSLHGVSIDQPALHAEIGGREFPIAGWVLGEDRHAIAVEISAGRDVLERIPLGQDRPDVEAADPTVPNARSSGFEGRIRFLKAPNSGFELSAVLDNQERVPIATISLGEECDDSEARLPSVSIVIPCYRQAQFLDESIGSVLRQSHPNIELVVVDDGSPDNTEEVVRRIPGVRYIRQTNRGLAGARNTGLRESNGEFLLFLDADDRLLPDALALGLARFRENPELGMVAGHFRNIGLNGFSLSSPRSGATRTDPYLGMLRDYYVGPPGVMLFRRAVFDRLGPFDTSISPAADYDMALRVARYFPVCVHRETVLEYRRHGANMTANPAGMLASTMHALAHQWLYSRRSALLRRAYQDGRRHWEAAWGDPLVEKVRGDLAARRWNALFRDLWSLLRFYPSGLLKLSKD